ncbi:MAG: hypothetical protein K6G58_09005 [Lachnospiraceae bacterium]|nr:hypothetical protein [Lachnospiraceae bacterium]
MNGGNTDFLLEKRLLVLSPDLHRRVTDTEFALQHILDRFRILFPEYTDHTQLHCMTVIDFCNVLIGPEQIGMMNADEIYILLSACYLHDSGMGIRMKEYEEFKDMLPCDRYIGSHPGAAVADVVREFHHEFSGLFIRKYSDLFDIPSKEHLFAIVQTSRGHRRTDLFDDNEYPPEYELPGGNTVCLPYLSALIRLADEIDVVASRNPILLYDIESLTDEIQIIENMKVKAVRSLITNRDEFIMVASAEAEDIKPELLKVRDKMQKTLDYCRQVADERSPYQITQKRVEIEFT